MIKYEIYKETIDALKLDKDGTKDDMKLFEECRVSPKHPILIMQFSDKKEAQVFFEEEKKKCISYYRDSIMGKVLRFDYIHIDEKVYDDNGNYKSSQILDYYINKVANRK